MNSIEHNDTQTQRHVIFSHESVVYRRPEKWDDDGGKDESHIKSRKSILSRAKLPPSLGSGGCVTLALFFAIFFLLSLLNSRTVHTVCFVINFQLLSRFPYSHIATELSPGCLCAQLSSSIARSLPR